MGGYNAKDPLIPRLETAINALWDAGYKAESDDVEEAIAVLKGRLALDEHGRVVVPPK